MLLAGILHRVEMDSRAKFGKETVAGHTGSQNRFHIYSAQADRGGYDYYGTLFARPEFPFKGI